MLFNSFVFWCFFAAVIVLYRRLRHRPQNRMLLVASYVFYGSWDWRFLSLILLSTVVNYLAALGINGAKGRRRKLPCGLSIVVSLGILATFKYFGFFLEEFQSLTELLGVKLSMSSLKLVLPVGISFYTFQTMSYTIDVYRGTTKAVSDFQDFALYVCFFPQLVAGPIERSSVLMPQVVNPRKNHPDDFTQGLYLILLGLFKKIVIADNLAMIVNGIFAKSTGDLSGMEALAGIYAFAFQIYGDFSGYSTIARGLSRWMGFDLTINFRMPYLATTPSDFWQRWHISLSSWLRDYLYIPLGGNRGGPSRLVRNLMLTMVLGGLWHGAAWKFLAWGGLHGLILCLYRPFEKRKSQQAERLWWRTWAARLLMFHLVCLGWLLFRADSMAQVWGMLVQIATNFDPTPLGRFSFGMLAMLTAPLMLLEYVYERKGDLLWLTRTRWQVRAVVYAYMVWMMIVFQPVRHSEFIYFQF